MSAKPQKSSKVNNGFSIRDMMKKKKSFLDG